jgi:flagellar hook-associated protein 1 FlgK
MGLSQALDTAVSGLRASQAGLSLVAANVANAGTPGYVRKTANLAETAGNGVSIGVNTLGVQREINTYVQSQLRTETSGGSYADLKSQFYQQLQGIYGTPGSDSSLETLYSNFTSAVQGLTATPSDYSAQAGVLGAAQALAQQLNQTSNSIQALRSSAEMGISDAVQNANAALQAIAQINQRLGTTTTSDAATASLQDQRDSYIDQLSKLMDVRVTTNPNGQVSVFTGSGIQLVGDKAATLTFNAQGAMSANSQYSADPKKSTVGTITLSVGGSNIDLISNGAIRSGQIAAYIEMRDKILPQAQNQLDSFAAAMASSLSDKTTAGTPTSVTSTGQSGFDIDIGGLQAGNKITLTYTDTATNTQKTLSLVRVDDPSVLPLADSVTTDPNDKVVGIDWSGGMSSVVSQLNALTGGRIQFSNPSGTTLEVLDDGLSNTVKVNSISTTTTAAGLSGGSSQLPFFIDGTIAYTGQIGASGAQITGLAGRLAVNPLLQADAGKLVAFSASTDSGDATRPNFIYNQLTSASQTYAPTTGFGSAKTPFSSSLPAFLQQIMSQQGDAASSAQSLAQGQDLVVNALQQKFDEASGVNVDQEMANLVTLQTAYAATARVLSTVKDTLDTLLRIGQ